jgi:hypothetical protein
MNPSDAHSSLAALRQLKEMLDAGTITPQEFELLKRQLIAGLEPALPLPTAADSPASPPTSYLANDPSPETVLPKVTVAATETAAFKPAELTPAQPAANPDWLAAAAPSLLRNEPVVPAEERRNPLNLVFIVGGALVLLGIVVYLLMGRPAAPDEHLTSASQTAADSTASAPEVGPQAEQITLPPVAAPETVRVAPVARPLIAPAASQFKADSVAAPVPAPPPAKAPAAATPPATMSTDSTTKTP